MVGIIALGAVCLCLFSMLIFERVANIKQVNSITEKLMAKHLGEYSLATQVKEEEITKRKQGPEKPNPTYKI